MFLLALFACGPVGDGKAALAFDGPPDCATIDNPGEAPTALTMEMWLRGDPDAGPQLRPLAIWSGVFELTEREDGVVSFAVGDDGAAATYAFSLFDGVVHHVAGTYDGADGTVRLFVDGKLAGANEAFPGEADDRIQVGCAKAATEGWYGVIDEIRLSSTVRYTGDFTRPESAFKDDDDTVMLFHLDEGTGETATSATGGAEMFITDAGWVEFDAFAGTTE